MVSSKSNTNLSIVIPTLGEAVLLKCLNSIYLNTLLPLEIIIVIPRQYKNRVNKINKLKLVRIIYSPKKGQVFQRILGFKTCKCDYVMQLDSDIILSKDSIYKLLYSIRKFNGKNAISPNFLIPKKFNNRFRYRSKLFTLIKNFIINGSMNSKPGIITDIGYNTWFIDNYYNENYYKLEWLPGGCILFNKKSLVKNNYFPFSGRAYCEDVIHSIILTANKVDLYFFPNIIVINDDYSKEVKTLKSLFQEFKIRFYLLKKIKGSKIRFFLWFIFYFIASIFKK